MRPYVLAETTWHTVKNTDYEVAILPWGATEAHNYHLPYATDTIQCDYIAAEAARLAWERDAKVVVLATSVGAYAEIDAQNIIMDGIVAAPDGSAVIQVSGQGKDPQALGEDLAEQALVKGAAEVLHG